MMRGTFRTISEFPQMQGLWTPSSLDECSQVLDHLNRLPDVSVGILFLCLTGMRHLESWFAKGVSRPIVTCRIALPVEPQTYVEGARLVRAISDIDSKDRVELDNWTQLCALVVWSELRGGEINCLWTERALQAFQNPELPEAHFFPWALPTWRHDLDDVLHSGSKKGLYEMALRRGLNPVMIRGLAQDSGSCAKLDASHFSCARELLRVAVNCISHSGANLRRLDRYYSPDATRSSLGVSIETARFRAGLFQWLQDSNLYDDEYLLTTDALLHLREYTCYPAVSCNSFAFRWRTRNPFSYQQFTLGQLYQALSLLGQSQKLVTIDDSMKMSDAKTELRILATRLEKRTVEETRLFQARLKDNQVASGTVFRIPANSIGQEIYPDIVKANRVKGLNSIVRDYENETKRDVLVAISGGYFLDDRTVPQRHPEWLGMPVGLLKCDGKLVSGPFFSGRPVLCIDYDHDISLQLVTRGTFFQESGSLAEAYRWSDTHREYARYRAAIEAGPLLIRNGNLELDFQSEKWAGPQARAIQAAPVEMPDLRTMRAAIAKSRTGDVYLIAVHGRIPESVGMTHHELADWLVNEIGDIDWAVEMDAGGSVTTWHASLGVTTVGSSIGGCERAIASAILFSLDPSNRAQPGLPPDDSQGD